MRPMQGIGILSLATAVVALGDLQPVFYYTPCTRQVNEGFLVANLDSTEPPAIYNTQINRLFWNATANAASVGPDDVCNARLVRDDRPNAAYDIVHGGLNVSSPDWRTTGASAHAGEGIIYSQVDLDYASKGTIHAQGWTDSVGNVVLCQVGYERYPKYLKSFERIRITC